MAGGGTFRASRGKGSRGAKSRSLQTRTSPTSSSSPTILLQPQCPLSSGTTPQLVSRTPHEPATIVEVGESSPHSDNTDVVYYLEQEVSRMISKDFRGNFNGKQTEWNKLDKNLVEHLYKCFQDPYMYDEPVDPKLTDIRDETWIEPTKIELFERVHKLNKGKGEWCDARAENVHSKYRDILKEKNTYEVEISDEGIVTDANPPLPAPAAFDAQAWVKPFSTKRTTFHASTSANNESNNESEIAELKRENAALKASVEQILKTLKMQQVSMPSNE
ncbi:hypothetical protein Tco_0448420 [Tanacetum coccineum]